MIVLSHPILVSTERPQDSFQIAPETSLKIQKKRFRLERESNNIAFPYCITLSKIF